jgi:TctA family transporter
MNLAVYGIGYLLVIAGVAYLAHLLRIPQAWIGAIVLVLAGIGVLSAARMMKGGGSV